MDILGVVSSVSKVAIGAFFITLAVVGYEVFMLMKKRKEEKETQKEDVELPDFQGDAQANAQHFTKLEASDAAKKPLELRSRKVSKPFLGLLLLLLALIVLVTGFLIYRRSQVSNVNVQIDEEVSPVDQSDDDQTTQITGTPLGDEENPLPTTELATTPASETVSPTEILLADNDTPNVESTPIPTIEIDDQEPTVSVTEDNGETITPTVAVETETTTPTPATEITGVTTSTPIPTTLPEAGIYQTTLIVSIAALAVIYLALIL